MNVGDQETKKLTTGRLFVMRAGENNYRDLGNCLSHKADFSVTRKDHMKSEDGLKRVDLSIASELTPKYTFEFDEHTEEMLQLILLASQGADTNQAGGNTMAEVLTAASKQGRTYFTTKQGLSAVVVKIAAAVKVLNVDYKVDAGSGAVTILKGGGIPDGSNVTIDYTAAAITKHNFTAFKDLFFKGYFKYIEKDQFSAVPRQTTEFFGQCYITNWGENNGDFNKVALQAVPLDNPVVTARKD